MIFGFGLNLHPYLARKHTKASLYRPTSKYPFEWLFAGGPLAARKRMLAWACILEAKAMVKLHVCTSHARIQEVLSEGVQL